MDRVYDLNNLRTLVKESGLSHEKIARLTGVAPATLTSYLRGKPSAPSINNFIALADFFAVPLDFITGRCNKELADKLLSDYSHYFMELRRAPYENYLMGRNEEKGTTFVNADGEAPWPYNLLDAVFGKTENHGVIDADREAGIMMAIEALNLQQKTMTLAYYRDGYTQAKIAKKSGVSPERVRQVIGDSLRRLRHPNEADLLRYGKNVSDRMREIERLESELAKKERELAIMKEKLNNRYAAFVGLRELLSECDETVAEYTKQFAAVMSQLPDRVELPHVIYNMELEEMGLPMRAHNCMKRAGCSTLGDIVALVESGKLFEVRNLGNTIAEVILSKVKELTDKDFFADYGLR